MTHNTEITLTDQIMSLSHYLDINALEIIGAGALLYICAALSWKLKRRITK